MKIKLIDMAYNCPRSYSQNIKELPLGKPKWCDTFGFTGVAKPFVDCEKYEREKGICWCRYAQLIAHG